jgi:hypothetical protein
MDAQSGLTLFNAIATAGKTIYEVAQGTSKLETKQQLMDVYDTLMNLKREAAELEDANRDLRQKLRFRSDDFEFKNPFWYEKTHADRPLCAKCFANEKVAPMGEPYRSTIAICRRCLVCDNRIEIEPAPRNHNYGPAGPRGSTWG